MTAIFSSLTLPYEVDASAESQDKTQYTIIKMTLGVSNELAQT